MYTNFTLYLNKLIFVSNKLKLYYKIYSDLFWEMSDSSILRKHERGKCEDCGKINTLYYCHNCTRLLCRECYGHGTVSYCELCDENLNLEDWIGGMMKFIRRWVKRKFNLYDIDDLQIGGHCGCCGIWISNVIVEKGNWWTLCNNCKR